MDDIGLGPIAPIIEAIPEPYRPWVVTAVAFLFALSFLIQVLKPIGELLLSVWRSLVGSIIWVWRQVFPPPGPQPGPDPAPEPIPSEETIWETRPVVLPVNPIAAPPGIPIVTIANMKGGVGKTTITANLAVACQQKIGKPVLVIDFDYQGSLTEMMWKHSGRSDPELRAHSLISGRLDPVQAQAHARVLSNGLESIELYSAGYPLATIENNIMIDWVKGDVPDDIRFRLSRLLRAPAFQERYGMVLIDCPPRITTGTINALCASTHLLIPTRLDEMSAEAAVYFMRQILRIQRRDDSLFPTLRILGVVPSMTREAARLADYEQRAIDRLEQFGKQSLGRNDLLMMGARVPDRVDISRTAGVGVSYLRKSIVRPIFDRLAGEILERV